MIANQSMTNAADTIKPPLWRSYRRPRYWPIWLLFGMMRLSTHLPYRLHMGLGRGLGQCCHWLAKRSHHTRAHVVRVNIQRCFPSMPAEEQKALEKRIWQSMGMGIMETSLAWWGKTDKVNSLITEMQGLEHLENAIAAKQPVQLIYAHFSAFELGCRWLGDHYKAFGTAKRYRNALSHHIIQHRRCQYAQNIFFSDELKKIMQAIRTLDPVVFLMDINTRFGVETTFMGSTCIMSTINAKLAKSLKTQMIPMRIYRRADNQGYGIAFDPPLQLASCESEADVGRLLQQHIEKHISDYPDQYFWLHRRFKNQTDGSNPYKVDKRS